MLGVLDHGSATVIEGGPRRMRTSTARPGKNRRISHGDSVMGLDEKDSAAHSRLIRDSCASHYSTVALVVKL